jgi:uncharacterized protein involved in exopolysaccharide biosynthesis
MQQINLEQYSPAAAMTNRTPGSLRDCMALAFRHARLMVWSFLIIFLGVVLITWMMPPRYDSQTKILVKSNRVDQVVSPDRNTQLVAPDMTETDLNSEVELLKSRDLLEKVVVETRLQNASPPTLIRTILVKLALESGTTSSGQDPRVPRAVRALEEALKVESIRRTKLIQISYGSQNPQLAASVLHSLVRLYLEKHLAVHRLPGAMDFFQSQTDEYRRDLANAEHRLVEFSGRNGVVAATLEKELMVKKLNDSDSQLQQTRAAIAETEQRIKLLDEQSASTPARLTTQMRTSDNPYLLQQVKSTLLSLELKRTELLDKFTPEYRPVQELEAQIAQATEALANAERNPVREETTDRDTTHEWIVGELAKARAELTALQARLVATSQAVERYRQQAAQLNAAEIAQQDLIRSTKTAEENFLLYTRKQEEARISDALDRQRIVNVSVAEEATVAALPSSPKWSLNLLLGIVLAVSVSVGSAVIADCLDHSLRTPDEVELCLNIPVLASLPKI